jgi:hypothetical protein
VGGQGSGSGAPRFLTERQRAGRPQPTDQPLPRVETEAPFLVMK